MRRIPSQHPTFRRTLAAKTTQDIVTEIRRLDDLIEKHPQEGYMRKKIKLIAELQFRKEQLIEEAKGGPDTPDPPITLDPEDDDGRNS